MKKSKKATSIVEAIVVILIVVTWVTWMYSIYSESIKLSNSTTNKIQAIQIARQGIEAFTNIRDTNWQIFSWDYTNCWNVLNYDSACIWDMTTNYDIWSWSYIIYVDSENKWLLESNTTDNFWSWTYIDDFKVQKDSLWIYTQSWLVDFNPIFTREIKVDYIEDTNLDLDTNSNDEKMKITSLVQWVDSSSSNVHKVELGQILSNWKK